MRMFISILFLSLFSISVFSQNNLCIDRSVSFRTNKTTLAKSYVLVMNGELASYQSISKLFAVPNLAEGFTIKTICENEMEVTQIETNSKIHLRLTTIDSTATFLLCLDELSDKLTFFFLNDVNEVVLHSNTGIPFLSFTKIVE